LDQTSAFLHLGFKICSGQCVAALARGCDGCLDLVKRPNHPLVEVAPRGFDARRVAARQGAPRRQGTTRDDKGYDADWFRQALAERGITACIPSKFTRKIPIKHDRTLHRQRHKIENMFGRLKGWRRVHARYDRCAHTFMSAICIAAIVIFWINQ
jgi:transposase